MYFYYFKRKKKMEKIKIKNLSVFELIQLHSACQLLYKKLENEYIAYKSQFTPSGLEKQRETIEEMEKQIRKYNSIYNKIIQEIGLRIETIDDDKKD